MAAGSIAMRLSLNFFRGDVRLLLPSGPKWETDEQMLCSTNEIIPGCLCLQIIKSAHWWRLKSVVSLSIPLILDPPHDHTSPSASSSSPPPRSWLY